MTTPADRPRRRTALRGITALPLAALAPPALGAQPKPLRLALAPFLSPVALLAAYRPLREHLERELARPVAMVTERDFQALMAATQRGDHDGVQLPAHLARLAMVDWQHLPVAILHEAVTAVVLVKAGGPVQDPPDLRGRRVGMLHPLSLTATMGRRWLASQGLAADVTVLTQPSVNSALYALDRDEIAALVCADTQLPSLPPSTPRNDRVLATIGRMAAPIFVASPALPAPDLAALRAAMFSFQPDPSRPRTASNSPLRLPDAAELAALDALVPLARQALAGAR